MTVKDTGRVARVVRNASAARTWLMKPMTWPRSQEGSRVRKSQPSSVTVPSVGS